MSNPIPRPEYPRPQFVRSRWMNLNGQWQFELDQGDSGLERGLTKRELTSEILVPFAPESVASGVENTDFLNAVWYRRVVSVPAEWEGQDLLLHFGAVDHDATVWVNDVEVARHRGGFSSFTADISRAARAGEDATIVVRARDTPTAPQARGKQATWYDNSACFYTRTTGIWQTVWLEPVPRQNIRSLSIVPQRSDSSFTLVADLSHRSAGLVFEAVLSDGAGEVTRRSIPADDFAPRLTLQVPDERVRLWSPEDPHLYDIVVRLLDGEHIVDEVASYAGMRSIAIDGHRVLLNGKPVFQRLVLDQGYWPETLMTAPDDEALKTDIELAMTAGFNGARLHQKVFEERYFYHADRLGYLVWAEFGDWGAFGDGPVGESQQPTASFITQWLEVVQRDRSHPSIIGWCPLNETYQVINDRITQLDDVTLGMYLATKAADPTRPVIDASGYSHRVPGADIYDSHSYEQDPTALERQQASLSSGEPYTNELNGQRMSVPYQGQPYFVSEYGGIWWNPALVEAGEDDSARNQSWGYGQRVESVQEWHERFEGLTLVLMDDPMIFGYCYTQLTDTFQEENGIYDSHRRPKFDIGQIREVQLKVAAYEMGDTSMLLGR